VRNLDDGRVEAVFEGEDVPVRAVVDFCRVGPRGASVTGVAVVWEPYQAMFQSFEII